MIKMSKNVGIKSTKLYEIKCNTGKRHYISLVLREYKGRKSLYIVKIIYTYKDNEKYVYRYTTDDKFYALNFLLMAINYDTIDNINFQKSLAI